MTDRVSVSERLEAEAKPKSPVDKFFQPAPKKAQPKKKKAKSKKKKTPPRGEAEELRRQTYYLPEVMIDALKLKKVFDDKELSLIVREALEKHIEKKYMDMAKENYKK